MAKFCIDPGHGGSDCGAVGPSGLRECDVALNIAKILKQKLEEADHEVIMTRTTDVDVAYPGASASEELEARCDIANHARVDCFISIHCNAAENVDAHGAEVYYHMFSRTGRAIAKAVQNNLIDLGLQDRGIKTNSLYVINYTSMPAVLVETAFISNTGEEALLNTMHFQTKLAGAIADGLLGGRRDVDKR